MKKILYLVFSFLLITNLSFGATSKIAVTEGSGKNIATHSISEDAVTKEVQRVVASNSAGAETGVAALPLQVSLANTGTNATAVKVDGTGGSFPVTDSGGALTVDGTVTANLSATDNAVLDSIQAGTDKIPALGQALAAASVPVVLTAAQLTTLTPPGAITGYALETGGNLATIAGAVSSSKMATKSADGDFVTLGAKADDKSTATDTTAISAMSVLKEISYMAQNPASRAVTNAGTFATQATLQAGTAEIGKLAAGTAEIGNVKNAGTFATQESGAALTALQVIDNFISGSRGLVTEDNSGAIKTSVELQDDTVATSGSATTAKGTTIMGAYDSTNPTAVDDGDAVAIRTDATGCPIQGYNSTMSSATLQHATAQTDHELIAAPAAGLSIYVTDIIVSNGATAGDIVFEEDTASAKTVKIANTYFAANGGMVCNFRTPIKCTAAKNFGFTSTTVTTHTVTASYYVAP